MVYMTLAVFNFLAKFNGGSHYYLHTSQCIDATVAMCPHFTFWTLFAL